ncbi:hypothetical protein BS78_03G386500 [Paspalum vaginatum]|nr:hypothetical protein BS78_03G386500 [Paspalum vaginatum]
MGNIGIKEFEELTLHGSNYLTWASDVKIAFASRRILPAVNAPVQNGLEITDQMKYTALLLLKTSIHKDLKREYLLEENPYTLWVALKERYKQQKELIYPEADHEWNHLRIQDFKSVADYDHRVHDICTRLKFCDQEPMDAEKIRKTLSTMHPGDRVLTNQYRKENHQIHSQLIHSLTQAERHDELQLKNHHLRHVGLAPLSEVNYTQNKATNNKMKFKPDKEYKRARGNATITNDKPRLCHKCGCNTHFAAPCRTPKHLVDLYLKSIRGANKGSKYEAHFNQATEENKQAACSSKVPHESPNNNAFARDMDNMMIEYNLGNICGDLVYIPKSEI